MEFIKTIKKDNLQLSVQLMDTLNEDEIAIFLTSYYRSFGLRYSLDSKWFKWFYNENPFGKCRNYVLTNEKNDIVGGYGFSLFNYSFQKQNKNGVIGINGFINPDYTGLGLYTELIDEALQDIRKTCELAFTFLHTNNIATIKGHLKGDWKLIKKFYFYIKTLNSNEDNPLNENISESAIEELKDYHFSSAANLFFIKSYDWLYWRFYKRPDKNYKILIYKLNNKIEGYFIYTLYNDKEGNNRCQIADYDYREKSIFIELLKEMAQLGVKNNYSTIEFLVNEEHCDTEILNEQSFVKKEESYEMFINGDLARFNANKDFKFEYGYFDVI